ncbi:hypothetical protein ACFQX7_37625 [Luedemannella flava]
MHARLIRAVVALYPAAMRERYGDEIADLLVRSRRPGATFSTPPAPGSPSGPAG